MLEIPLPVIAAWANVGLLSLAGLVNLTGVGPVRAIYADWDIPSLFYRSVGLIQIFAAVFLATPELRLWGILLAGPIMFGSVVMLLDHRYYAVAAPVAGMLAALVIAILAVPPVEHRYYMEPAAPSVAAMNAPDASDAAGFQF